MYYCKDFFLFQMLSTCANLGAVHGSSDDSDIPVIILQRCYNLFYLNRVVTTELLELLVRHLETSTVK